MQVYKTLTSFLNLIKKKKKNLAYFFIFFLTYTKMSKNSSGKYYQDNKELKKDMKDIKSFLKKKKKKEKYGQKWYKNISKNQKQSLVEYRKKYEMRKKFSTFIKIVFFRWV